MILDLQVGAGTAFGLVGNNGAGKTTFLRLVLDLIHADEGAVQHDGEFVAALLPALDLLVFDEPTDPDTLEALTTYFAETIRPKEEEAAAETP